jgi:hypothetical protein
MSVIPLSSISLDPMAVIEAGVSTTVDDLFRAVTTISSMSSEKIGKDNKKVIKIDKILGLNIALPTNELKVKSTGRTRVKSKLKVLF